MSTPVGDQPSRPAVGPMLRTWRERRRYSQLELASEAGVSTRHLSFVENGRSRPTAEMVLRLAEHLDVPLRERDRLLVAAGHAPRHDHQPVDPGSIEAVMGGLRGLLDAHAPYPALLLDGGWDVLDANPAAYALLAGCRPDLLEPPVNALRVALHPEGLAPRIRNRAEWSDHLLRQATSRAQRTHDPGLRALVEELTAHVDTSVTALHRTASPVLALELETPAGVLRMFSVVAQLETSSDSLLEGLHVETFLPADEATRRLLTRS